MQSDFVSRGYAEHLRNAIKETRGAGLENFLSRPVFNGLVLEVFEFFICSVCHSGIPCKIAKCHICLVLKVLFRSAKI